MRRNLQADIGVAFADFARELFDILDVADDAECLGVDEAIDELPALDRAVFVQDDHGHVFDVVIERVAERDHLDQRREEHEEKRERIAQDADEFLEENGAEAAEGALHLRRETPNAERPTPNAEWKSERRDACSNWAFDVGR